MRTVRGWPREKIYARIVGGGVWRDIGVKGKWKWISRVV